MDMERMVFGLIFGSIAGIFFLVVRILNLHRERIRMQFIHQERLAAIEKGLLTPEVADYDSLAPPPYVRVNPRWPIGFGTLLVMGGLGLLTAQVLEGRHWSYSLVPIFLGVGLWLHYLVMRPRDGR
jgi:hypothetical protein